VTEDYWRPEKQHKMRFRNVRILEVADPQPYDAYPESDGEVFTDGIVVGKVRPWDQGDEQYILYADGDLMIAAVVPEREEESTLPDDDVYTKLPWNEDTLSRYHASEHAYIADATRADWHQGRAYRHLLNRHSFNLGDVSDRNAPDVHERLHGFLVRWNAGGIESHVEYHRNKLYCSHPYSLTEHRDLLDAIEQRREGRL